MGIYGWFFLSNPRISICWSYQCNQWIIAVGPLYVIHGYLYVGPIYVIHEYLYVGSIYIIFGYLSVGPIYVIHELLWLVLSSKNFV